MVLSLTIYFSPHFREKEEDLEAKYDQLNEELRRILAKDGKLKSFLF